jgi:flagellar biosynthetic protein FliQ
LGTDQALGFLNDMLWKALIVAAPILLATLLVGLLISVFQVATQIQEITLSYVPKIAVAAFMLILLGPWMSATIAAYARGLYLSIPALVAQ